MQSGPCNGPYGPLSPEEGIMVVHNALDAMNTTFDELQTMDYTEIIEKFVPPKMTYTVDGKVLSNEAKYMYNNMSKMNAEAIMIGATSLDTTMLDNYGIIPLVGGIRQWPNTTTMLEGTLLEYFQNEGTVQSLMERLDGYSPKVAWQIIHALTAFVCPTKELTDLLANTFSEQELFYYMYGYNPVAGDYKELAIHGSEIYGFFGIPFGFLGIIPPSEELMEEMVSQYTGFIKGENLDSTWTPFPGYPFKYFGAPEGPLEIFRNMIICDSLFANPEGSFRFAYNFDVEPYRDWNQTEPEGTPAPIAIPAPEPQGDCAVCGEGTKNEGGVCVLEEMKQQPSNCSYIQNVKVKKALQTLLTAKLTDEQGPCSCHALCEADEVDLWEMFERNGKKICNCYKSDKKTHLGLFGTSFVGIL